MSNFLIGLTALVALHGVIGLELEDETKQKKTEQ